VRRLFELLLKFTQHDVPGFQLIVTELRIPAIVTANSGRS
jgi:hypothetical protein